VSEFFSGIFQNLLADVLFALLGAALLWLVARRFRWRILAAIFRLQRNGVSNIYLSRSEYISRRSLTVQQFIETAERTFSYVGVYFSLATDQSRIDQTIRALLAKKCRVVIVLLDTHASNELIAYLEEHLALAHGTLLPRVQHAQTYFGQLRSSLAPAEYPSGDGRLAEDLRV
jgi:hypothetical protein